MIKKSLQDGPELSFLDERQACFGQRLGKAVGAPLALDELGELGVVPDPFDWREPGQALAKVAVGVLQLEDALLQPADGRFPVFLDHALQPFTANSRKIWRGGVPPPATLWARLSAE
jgi:hypothetical protein